MNQRNNKILSYIGFALKSHKYAKGIYSVKLLKKAGIILIAEDAGNNSMKEAVLVANKLKCPLIKAKGNILETTLKIDNCKIMAITDDNLAQGIMNNLGEDFTQINGGTNNG